MSEAATSRSTPSLNSTVTRLRPKDELDEIDLTPETRDTAPSMHGGQLAVDGFGRGALEVGVDGDDRAVDVGQFADLDAVEGGKAGDDDQRVEHEGQHRPAHEQRRQAGFAAVRCWISGHRRARLTSRCRRRRASRRGAGVVAWRSAPRRPRARAGRLRSPRCRRGRGRPSTSTFSVLRWTMRTGVRLALPSRTAQTKAPSVPHWMASGSTDG